MDLYLTMAIVPKHDARGRLFNSLRQQHRRKPLVERTNVMFAVGLSLLTTASGYAPIPGNLLIWATWILLVVSALLVCTNAFNMLFESGMMHELRMTPIRPSDVIGEVRAFAMWLVAPLVLGWFFAALLCFFVNGQTQLDLVIQPLMFGIFTIIWGPLIGQNIVVRVDGKALRRKAKSIQDSKYRRKLFISVMVYIFGIAALFGAHSAVIANGWFTTNPFLSTISISVPFFVLLAWFLVTLIRLRKESFDIDPVKKAEFERELDELFIEAIERKAEKKRS